jgi:hypothetical protein
VTGDVSNRFAAVTFPLTGVNPSSSSAITSASSTTITSASSASGTTTSNRHLVELCSQLINQLVAECCKSGV